MESMNQENDMNLVALWLRKDPLRWLAGAMGGIFAGTLMLLFAMGLAYISGVEVWFPIKVAALPFLGSSATEIGLNPTSILYGLLFSEGLCLLLGVLFAHFTGTNNLKALAPMGLVWGVFTWIFICNLFTQSFHPVFAAQISPSITFPVALVFGLSLVSVAFFDRVLRH